MITEMNTTIDNIVDFLKESSVLWCRSSKSISLRGGAPISTAKQFDLTFLTNQSVNAIEILRECRASLILIDQRVDLSGLDLAAQEFDCVLAVPDARLAFIKVLNRFFAAPVNRGHRSISAIVSQKAVCHESVFVAEGAVISAGCVIGENSCIGAYSVLHAGTIVGRNTVIESHCTIGSDGFGFQRDESGELHKFPHDGNVVIGDNIEVGCSVCIDRGTMGSTIIGDGSKIDNFVHIAHNVVIGKHVLVVAQAGICGKVSVGDRAYIGPSSCISQGVTIGEDAFVGLGAFVTQDVDVGLSVLGRGVGYLVDRRPRELSLGGSWKPKEH